MAKPNDPILIAGQFFQVCLDRRQGGVRDRLLFSVEHELPPYGKRALVTGHKERFFFVHELFAVVMRRLLNSFEARAMRDFPETRLAKEQCARITNKKEYRKKDCRNHTR